MGGVYVVSVRTGLDHDAALREARLHLDADGRATTPEALAGTPFGQAGHTVADLDAFLSGVHALATDPDSVADFQRVRFDRTSNSEDQPIAMFMGGLGGATEAADWLGCAGALHATWPRLLDLLGVSVGGVRLDEDGEGQQFKAPDIRTPKRIRLRSGWDYDADWNPVHLDPAEAARRLAEHEATRKAAGR